MKDRKILFLITSLVGRGVGRVLLNLLEDWRGHGVNLVVATMKSKRLDAYVLPEGVQRIALDIADDNRSWLSMARNSIVSIVRVRRMLREEKPDVVIGMAEVSVMAVALARGQDMVAIGAEHGCLPEQLSMRLSRRLSTRIWKLLLRYAYGRLDAVVALTSDGGDWLREHTRARNVAVIANSISLPAADGEPRIAVRNVVPSGWKILLAGGWFAEEKGFDRLLAAFAQVAGRYENWRLVILGEGKLRGALERQVVALGLEGRVCLPGFAGNMASWYRAADVFVLPSLIEGFPMALLEAMAHGCAVASTDCGGPRHIIRDGENGLLVAQGDEAALAAGLERLMGDEGLRQRLGEAAVEVCDRFSPERIRGQWWSLFGELQEQRRV